MHIKFLATWLHNIVQKSSETDRLLVNPPAANLTGRLAHGRRRGRPVKIWLSTVMWPKETAIVVDVAVWRIGSGDVEHLCRASKVRRRSDERSLREPLLQWGRTDLNSRTLVELEWATKVTLTCRLGRGRMVAQRRGSHLLTADRSASCLPTLGTRLNSDRCGIGITLRLALAVFAIASSRANAVLDSMLSKSPVTCLLGACLLIGRWYSFECLHRVSQNRLKDLPESLTAFMERLWRTLFCQPLLLGS